MTATTGDLAGTFAVSDSVDRLLVVLVSSYDSGGSTGQTFAAAYGGQPLSQAFLQNSNRRQTWIGYLTEADIAGRSGDALTVTVTGDHTSVAAYIASYSGVDQAAPLAGAGGVWLNSKNNDPIGGPLPVSAGGYGVYGWSGEDGTTQVSDTESYVVHSNVDNAGTYSHGVASRGFSAAGTTDPSVEWTASNVVSVSFITLNPSSTYPVPSTAGISPASKSTGEAAFTLTVNGASFVSGAVCRSPGRRRQAHDIRQLHPADSRDLRR